MPYFWGKFKMFIRLFWPWNTVCFSKKRCDTRTEGKRGFMRNVHTFPVKQVILGVNTSWAEGGSSRGGRPLRRCLGGGGSSTSPSLKTVSTPGVPAPGLWPLLLISFCTESLRQLTSANPLMCKSSAVFNNDDSLVCKIESNIEHFIADGYCREYEIFSTKQTPRVSRNLFFFTIF